MDYRKFKNLAFIFPIKGEKKPCENTSLSERIHLIYQRNRLNLIFHSFFALCATVVLWQILGPALVFSTLTTLLILYLLWFYSTSSYHNQQEFMSEMSWLILFSMFALFTGIVWGFAAYSLLFSQEIFYQIAAFLCIFVLSSCSIYFYSPIFWVHLLFLLALFLPFLSGFFIQGGAPPLYGFFVFVYLLTVLGCGYYSHLFLKASLGFRDKNLSINTLNNLLEDRLNNKVGELEKALAITKSTLESTADGILVINLEGNIEYYNQKFLDMWQMPQHFKTQPNLQMFISEVLNQIQSPNNFLKILDEIHQNPSHENFDEIVVNENKIFEWYSKPHWMQNLVVGRAWSFRDITVRKQMEQQLAYQANHDLLTNLPNRTLLLDRVNQGIAYAKRYRTNLFLLFLDIDNFKLINDNLGHHLGDILLMEIAKRLITNTRDSDTVSRFGGDEFVILFVTNKLDYVLELAQKTLDNITNPLKLAHHEIQVSASAGVSLYPKDGTDAETLLKSADIAMYLAKNQGGNNYKLYDKSMKKHSEKSLAMQIELRSALANNEFFLLYQPTVNLTTGQVVGVEALIRWRHPTKGVIQPLQFIPIAEESRIIVLLGEWVFRKACLQNKAWQKMGIKPVYMAINVSGVQLLRENFITQIQLALEEAELEPQYIEIELTESTIMDDRKQNLSTLKQLVEMGLTLTIDDFGTGHSSLNYLREFPVSKLKIDQSFIQNSINSVGDASIVEAIVAMGHGLKLRVLAEGIETVEQLRFLKRCQCDEGQGFLYGQPMSATALAKLLHSNLQFINE